MEIPNWLYNVLVTLFILNASSLVVIFVGWLTHANYYYKMLGDPNDFDSGLFLYVHSFITGTIGFVGVILYFTDDSKNSAFNGILGANAIYILSIGILHVCFYTSIGIDKARQYFANKRGIK